MASKWDEIVKTLKPVPEEDPKFQDKVNKAKDNIRKQLRDEGRADSARSYAELYQLNYRVKKELEAQIKLLNIEMAALTQMLAKAFEEKDPAFGAFGATENLIRLEHGGSVGYYKEPIGVVTDKMEFRQWCIDNGLENELQLHPSTTQSLVKTRLEEGEEEPDGIDIYFRNKIVVRS